MTRSALMSSAAAVFLAASPAVVAAQDEAAAAADADTRATTGEIIVTARKREERLVDVPGPITALSPTTITDARLQEPRDLLLQVPGAFLVENNAGTARDISIRGVGTPTLFAEPGVAMYVDEVYSSGFISFPTQFYDLERVEVLRGPQGALYGRNAVGGAVNVISKRPTDELSGMIRSTVARYDRSEVEAMANLPVGDSFGVRVSGLYIDQNKGEYLNTVTDEFIDKQDSISGRVVAKFDPGSGFSATLIYEHTDADTPGTALFFRDAGETRRTIRRDTQPRNSYNVDRLAAELAYDSDSAGTFTLIAGGRDYKLRGTEDTDLSDNIIPDLATGNLGQQVTTRFNRVESRFGELRWLSPQWGGLSVLAGVTYLDESATGDIATDLVSIRTFLGGGTVPFVLGIANDQSLESWAAFLEADVDLADDVSVIASARYTDDTKRVNFAFNPTPALAGFGLVPQTANLSRGFSRFTPGVTLSWTPGDANIYAKIQTGFRAGGFNFNVANAANLEYGQETSVNYELGAKTTLMDGKALIGVSAYLLTQDDVLVPFFDFTAAPGLQGFLANAGKAETLGIELEGSVTPIEGVTLGGTIGWMDPEFTSGTFIAGLATVTPLDGLQLPATRRWSFSLNAEVRRPLSDRIDVIANAAYASRSGGFQDVANAFRTGDIDLLNLSAGLDFGKFDVLAFVQNAGNDRFDIAFGGNRNGTSGVTQAPGTTYGVSTRVNF
ncbi:iron complex outermembrane receptor protein [Erythromicrobium ramosum]|uniref:Iron complex outermembrane receptor protein n=1 Tax=Erythrobacter ramosus TaxID=35811 RepID=A0A6I4UI99_9SPHN|nr:iron complex outermembrane receptor protein [Erythrobacter ramosus]MXP38590.1 TonB-dependent receptor plug domain-containing protein [Erythrobacter ramosus]